MAEQTRKFSIEYSVFLEDGSQVDTNVGEKPLVYEEGEGQILPKLEEEIQDMTIGDSKRVTLSAEEAYGPVDPEAYQHVDLELIPEEAREVDAMLVAQDQDGNRRQVRVHEVHDDGVVLDLNHPLAGKSLTFDVKLLGVEG